MSVDLLFPTQQVPQGGGDVRLASCSTTSRQQWIYRGGRLEDSRGRNCLAMASGGAAMGPSAGAITGADPQADAGTSAEPLLPVVMRSCSDVEAGKLAILTS